MNELAQCCISMPTTVNEHTLEMLRQVRSMINDDGVMWLKLSDERTDEQLSGIPWRTVLALQADGWILRQDIIIDDDYLFMLTRSPRYRFNSSVIAEPARTAPGATWPERKAAGATAGNMIIGDGVRNGTQRVVHGKGVTSNLTRQDGLRNKRSVWNMKKEDMIELCILATTSPGDTVLSLFADGTAIIAERLNRNTVTIN